MSTYYVPQPQRTAAQRPSHDSEAMSANENEEQITLLDLQRSIYVFPNPSSAPPSPSGSSLSSVPSDFSVPVYGSPRPGTREHSLSLSSSNSRPRGRSRGSSSSGLAMLSRRRVVELSPSGPTLSDGGTDIDVEVWDWMADSEEASDENAAWQLEAEVERVGRWGIPAHSHIQAWPAQLALHASSSTPRPLAVTIPSRSYPLHSNNGRFQDEGRSRTQSNISVGSSLASAFSSFRLSAIQSPQPRIHIPLLSFIASLLSLDLDDPALRLLTSSNSTTESVLFPGTSHLDTQETVDDSSRSTSSQDSDTEDVDEDMAAVQPHGLLRLLVMSDESRISIRAVRDGIAVSCSTVLPTSVTPFSLPSFGSMFGFCRLVGDACLKGGKAWRELRT